MATFPWPGKSPASRFCKQPGACVCVSASVPVFVCVCLNGDENVLAEGVLGFLQKSPLRMALEVTVTSVFLF